MARLQPAGARAEDKKSERVWAGGGTSRGFRRLTFRKRSRRFRIVSDWQSQWDWDVDFEIARVELHFEKCVLLE